MRIRILPRIAEWIRFSPLLFLCILLLVWSVFYLIVPIIHSRDILAPIGEGDRVYFGNNRVLSQEFKPHVGLSGIGVPVGSDTYPNSPLLLHIRQTLNSEDIVSVPLFSFSDAVARFQFPPIWRVPEKLVWVLEAPYAPEHAYWVFREHDASIFREGRAYQNNQVIKGNIGFTETWYYPRISDLVTAVSNNSVSFENFEYWSLLFGIVGLLAWFVMKRIKIAEHIYISGFIIVGGLLHVWLGLVTPIIIDEGAYIQDVLQSTSALLPFRDFLTKGPMYIFFLWLWSFVVPNTVIAWRLFSVVVWGLGGFLFWKLTTVLGMRQRSRLLASFAFSLFPASVALTTPILLQTGSVVASLLGILLALQAVKKQVLKLAFWSAVVFTMAFFMRITAVIPACISALLFLFLAHREWRWRLLITYIGTGLLLFGLVFGSTVIAIGLPKSSVVVNLEALFISQNRQEIISDSHTTTEPIVRSLAIEARLLWRAGVLLLLPLFIIPFIFVNRNQLTLSFCIILTVFYISWNVALTLVDTHFLLPKTLLSTSLLIIILLFGGTFITAIATLLYGKRDMIARYLPNWQTLFLLVLWLLVTMFAYSKWGRFRQSYLTEFLPQLALLFGLGIDYLLDIWGTIKPKWFSRTLIYIGVFLASVCIYQGYAIAKQYPHTGTVDQQSLVKIVTMVQKYVPSSEQVFTAQPIATAFANRQIMFGYSHPGWYREARFGTISEELRDLLFRRPEIITEYLKNQVNFVLVDSRTDEIYFDGYPERVEILKNSFEEIGSVNNEMAGDVFMLYRRR